MQCGLPIASRHHWNVIHVGVVHHGGNRGVGVASPEFVPGVLFPQFDQAGLTDWTTHAFRLQQAGVGRRCRAYNLPGTQMRLRSGTRLFGVMLKLVGMLALVAMVGMLRAQQPAPDLILSNGKIITVDERFTIAQAVAIAGDRIVAVGTNQEMARLAGANTRRIDLMGKSVTPGLIDNHMHLLRAATTWLRELRLDGVVSRKSAVEMLRARAKAAGPGEWVYNIGGWAHQQFTDDPKPFTREELDQIAPENPVALQESYYQVFLNSRALKEFGIEQGVPDPKDFVKGSILRDAS